MGRRISFYITQNELSLEENIKFYFPKMRIWALERHKENLIDFEEEVFTEDLFNFLKTTNSLNISNVSQKIIDEIVLIYFEFAYENKIFEYIGPNCYTKDYFESYNFLKSYLLEDGESENDNGLIHLFSFLLKGRSLKNDHKFICPYNEFAIGFWKFEEIQVLKLELKKLIINPYYWENKKLIYDTNTYGIELVLEAIKEMYNSQQELIFFTENIFNGQYD